MVKQRKVIFVQLKLQGVQSNSGIELKSNVFVKVDNKHKGAKEILTNRLCVCYMRSSTH